MESDGPYCVINDETTGVVGPGLCADGEYVNGLEEAGRRCESLNTAYVEGRKSMEKELKELLDLANQAGNFNQDMMQWKIKFEDWKKAQGIENRIRGGQDGE